MILPIQAVVNGMSDSQNNRCRFVSRMPSSRAACGMHQVMVVTPVNSDVRKLRTVMNNTKAPAFVSWYHGAPSIQGPMMVMMMASTPSLKASVGFFPF